MRLPVMLAALCVFQLTNAAESQTAATEEAQRLQILDFEFLGCSGDWSGEGPEVWRTSSLKKTHYLVREMTSCGVDIARNPVAELRGSTLHLSFEADSSQGFVVMCPCETWAKFTFKEEASSPTAVIVNTNAAIAHGLWKAAD
jgi:hypothetical protein